MSEPAVCSVIQSLGKLQSPEARLSHGIRQQVERLDLKLKQLQAISRIADARQHEDDWANEWVSKTREVAFEAEDLLDIFAIQILSRNGRSMLRRPSQKKFNTLQDIEYKVNSQEAAWRARNSQDEILSSVSERRHRIRKPLEEDFVGLDEDIDKLVAQVINDDASRSCHVVSIIGRSGIGKTALARKVYHHEDVRGQFDAFAWAVVSQHWQAEEILQRILFELVPEKKEQIVAVGDIAVLIKELFDVQKTRKCLVVLDDVCKRNVWDSLRPAFPNQKSASRVLLTTRDRGIALHIDTDTTCYLYEQRHLTDSESWDLLQKKAFRLMNLAVRYEQHRVGSDLEDDMSIGGSFRSCQSVEEEDEFLGHIETPLSPHSEVVGELVEDDNNRVDMEEFRKELVEHCGGLPLAINLLGGLLMAKSNELMAALHESFKTLLRESSNEDTARVYEMLAVGYHDLPYQIKQCFWHLGEFPKSCKISTRKLYQLWAAEGFTLPIDTEENISGMDIAQRYLCELQKLFMVQVQVEESTDTKKYCQLHELVREMCILKAKEENFRKVIPPSLPESEVLTFSSSVSEVTSTRKVIPPFLPDSEVNNYSSSASEATSTSSGASHSLLSHVDSNLEMSWTSEQEDREHVRSALFSSSGKERKSLRTTLKWLCDNFKLLRVLDLERFELGEELCESIGNLVHLRFLSFRGSKFNKLPSSVGNLRFLETLDLRLPFEVALEIPDVLCKLSNLKNLYLPSRQHTSNKLQLSSLGSLEILKNFDPRITDFRDISKLNKLRKLKVIFCVEMEHLKAINKHLRMSSSVNDSSFRIHYNFESPKEINLLEQLVGCGHIQKLDLVGHLEKLPERYHFSEKLHKLTLRNSSLKEDPLAVLEKLPNLYSLTLRKDAYKGRRVCCSAKGFGKLRTIEVQGLTCLEDWIIEEGSMPNLEQIKLDYCTKLVMLPEGIKFLPSIAEIVIANMPEDFKQTIQRLQHEGINNLDKVSFIGTNQSSEQQHGPKQDRAIFRSFSPRLVPKTWQDR